MKRMLSLSRSTILLVEDDPDDILLMKRAFKHGCVTNPMMVVRDGQRAIRYLNGEGEFVDRSKYPLPGLVLLDLRLPGPGPSGFDVLKRLRQIRELDATIVIVLTSSDREDDPDKAWKLGAHSFHVKPRAFEDLVQLVNRIREGWLELAERSTRRAVPAAGGR